MRLSLLKQCFLIQLRLGEQLNSWVFIAAIRILCLVHQVEKAEVIFLRDRIVFVMMALGTCHGGPHPYRPSGIDTVHYRDIAEFFVTRPSLVVGHGIAMEGGRNQLIHGWIVQKIACQLLNGELVERYVRVETPYDIISVPPDGSRWVIGIPCRVGIPCLIQPPPCPMLSVTRLAQELVHVVPEGVRSLIRHERIHLWHGRRKPRQVEGHAPSQKVRICSIGQVLLESG